MPLTRLEEIIDYIVWMGSMFPPEEILSDDLLLSKYVYYEKWSGNQLTKLQLNDVASLIAADVSTEIQGQCRRRLRTSIKATQEFIDFKDQVTKQVKLILEPEAL